MEDSRYLGYLGFSGQSKIRYDNVNCQVCTCTGLHWYALARKLVPFPLKPPGGSGGG